MKVFVNRRKEERKNRKKCTVTYSHKHYSIGIVSTCSSEQDKGEHTLAYMLQIFAASEVRKPNLAS